MSTGISAAAEPGRDAIVMASSGQSLSFEAIEERSCRLAQLWRSRGIPRGGHVAILLDNHIGYLEAAWAAQRSGLRYTPINWHLGPDEAAYILGDCGATALVTSARFAELLGSLGPVLQGVDVRLAHDGHLEGFEEYESAIAEHPAQPLVDETEGSYMFYSSGTTGRPKGILPALRDDPFGTGTGFDALVRAVYGFEPGIVYLCPAPLYHAAPLGWSMAAQRVGGTVVIMERFDPLEALRAIERYQVTHAQFVPTHFVRMLKLSQAERDAFDPSSLRTVVHAAAPCPVEVKQRMLDWWGPIVYEYYAGSEGGGFCAVGPEEWLARPGTVGKSLLGTVHITDEEGHELPAGEVGQIWFESGANFEYHNDPQKTREAYNDRGWNTLGDVGCLDTDGYLFLTDRLSNMIISGGVNIYPQEIENALALHPEVADVGVIGVPDPEMGESVLAVVQPVLPATDESALAAELQTFCRERIAGFKVPRTVRFTDALPRLPTGKLLKRVLRERYGGSSAASVRSGLDRPPLASTPGVGPAAST